METKILEKGSISICFVHEALACIRSRGLDQNDLLMQVGISPELLASPHARVSSRHYGALWHLIAQTMDDEFFGMDRHRMKTGSFTLLCHTVIHSDTLERALRRALRFFRLVLDEMAGELIRDGETADLAVQAALTGHLVFSTLHTSNAATCLPRLLDMGMANIHRLRAALHQ